MIDKLRVLEQNSIQRGIPILGSEKGAWLLSIVQKHKPQRILELGTANGYSGIILGSGGARIVTVDINIVLATEANYNFAQFRIDAEIRLEDGVEYVQHVVKEKKEQFDLIFIDFAKKKYFPVLEGCIKLLKDNGILIADNITMEGCQNFREAVLHHPQLQTEIINIKDGLSYSIKRHL